MSEVGDLAGIMLIFAPLILTTLGVVAGLWLLQWVLVVRQPSMPTSKLIPRQLALLAATIAGVILIVLSLPVSESSRNQVVALIGLLLSGIFAFSSTSIVANLMAGFLLRFTHPFSTGDFIRVGDYFGRVSEPGLFDTEIQSEARELIAIPNSYLVSHPIKTTQGSGAIISVTVSLGYNVHHKKARQLLIAAAEDAGLESPYAHVTELLDHAVSYQVAGLLTEVKGVLTAKSVLHCAVLDAMHAAGVEIVSPAFMMQRRGSAGELVIPEAGHEHRESAVVSTAEDIVFDKAEQAEAVASQKQALRDSIDALTAKLATLKSGSDEAKRLQKLIEGRHRQLEALEKPEV